MSHVDTMELIITDLKAVEQAAQELGGHFAEAPFYKWYGRHVGDYPLPNGFKKEDLGKCQYKIHFDNVDYEVGITKNPNGDGHVAIYDFYDRTLHNKIGGPKAIKLQEKILKHQTINAAVKKGLKWKEIKTDEKTTVRVYIK